MDEKIYISPSSQPANMYAVGNVSEQEMCRKIADLLQEELERCGFTAYAGMSGTMYTRAAESNKLRVHLHLPIHTNAYDGKVAGLRIMVSKMGGEAEQIAKEIMATLAPITPGESDGISAQPQLYEIRATDAICVYLEVGFHDNREEAQWVIDHPQEIAEAIARGLCNHYGVKYSGVESAPAPEKKPAEPESTGVLHRVQVGAFGVLKYAEDMLAKVKAAGFTDAFITMVDGLYKVQVGAFSAMSYADNMMAEVEAAGFEAFVTTKSGQPVSASAPKKSVDEIAREVIQGKWGNGAERKKKLEAAGYDYNAVQARVNQLL